MPQQEPSRNCYIFDTKTAPPPTAPVLQSDPLVAMCLTAFLACLVDRIFCLATSLPSALMKKLDVFQENADFLTSLGECIPCFLQALPRNFTQAFSVASSPEPSIVVSDGLAPDSSGTSDQLAVLSHILSSNAWESLLDYLGGDTTEEASAGPTACLLTLGLYQAAFIAEEALSSSSSNIRSDRCIVMDASIKQLLQDCKAGIEGALLLWFPLKDIAGSASTCQPSSIQTALLKSNSAKVPWSTMPPLLRSSLLQLREVLKISCERPFLPRDWELIKAELLLDEAEEVWGVSSCCNASCTHFAGSCEVEVKTLTCGGMCGARYCSRACQELAWRAGHRRNCGMLKEMRVLAKQRKPVEALNVS